MSLPNDVTWQIKNMMKWIPSNNKKTENITDEDSRKKLNIIPRFESNSLSLGVNDLIAFECHYNASN